MGKGRPVLIRFLCVECLVKRNYLVGTTVQRVAMKVHALSAKYQLTRTAHVHHLNAKLNVGCFLMTSRDSFVRKYVRKEKDVEIIYVKLFVALTNSVII